VPDVHRIEVAAWSPLVALTLVLGLWPGLLLGVVDPAVALALAGASG
jgi:NADH-quinone oxidoreductase subunit M